MIHMIRAIIHGIGLANRYRLAGKYPGVVIAVPSAVLMDGSGEAVMQPYSEASTNEERFNGFPAVQNGKVALVCGIILCE
jgi:hypothetical protein